MDLSVCRNSAGVGLWERAPGNHGSARDARFAPDRTARRGQPRRGPSADDTDPMRETQIWDPDLGQVNEPHLSIAGL
jgi:hypothetical protein